MQMLEIFLLKRGTKAVGVHVHRTRDALSSDPSHDVTNLGSPSHGTGTFTCLITHQTAQGR